MSFAYRSGTVKWIDGEDYKVQSKVVNEDGSTLTVTVADGKYAVVLGFVGSIENAGSLTFAEAGSPSTAISGVIAAYVGGVSVSMPFCEHGWCWTSTAGADLELTAVAAVGGILLWMEVDEIPA